MVPLIDSKVKNTSIVSLTFIQRSCLIQYIERRMNETHGDGGIEKYRGELDVYFYSILLYIVGA